MKKILLAGLLLLALSFPAHSQVYIRQGALSESWTCSLAGLAAALTECKALSAGNRFYITDIVVQTTTTTAGSYSIQTGTGANCGSNTAALFPVNSTSARFLAPISTSPTANIHLTTPLVPPAGAAICVIGTVTNTINIQLIGWTAP